MAINKKTTPLSTPDNFASPVINQLAALLTVASNTKRASGGYILKGALFNIGGSMFMADSDTAISGTTSDYIKLTVSGDTATAAYTDDISDVSWNGAYQGCFDTDGNLYITDEQYGVHPPYTVLSGSGTYTVPPNVFVLHVKMYGPGSNGSAGGTSTGGNGGVSGGITEMDLNVEPMETYAYTITSSITTFGDNSARTSASSILGQTSYGNYGGNGGGFGGGSGGASQRNGHDATGTYGGGGGGGGAGTGNIPAGSGGSGALGRVELS